MVLLKVKDDYTFTNPGVWTGALTWMQRISWHNLKRSHERHFLFVYMRTLKFVHFKYIWFEFVVLHMNHISHS